LRKTRKQELKEAAEIAEDWLFNLRFSLELGQIHKVRMSLEVFGAKFWRGEPCLGDTHAWAVIEIYPDGKIEYCEKYNTSHGQSRHPWLLVSCLSSSTYEELRYSLIHILHPEYLIQFAEAIRSGKVWECIEQSLR